MVDRTLEPAGLESIYGSALVSLVETACLAHDIGNPPFGHFGEAAIREWFRGKWEHVAAQRAKDKKLQQLVQDFIQFDGNPQGTRILTRLQGRTQEERRQYGMDLTYSQVLTALKYPRGPLDMDPPKWKKAGFFESERSKIESAWTAFGFNPKEQRRFPLAYLVEAADDISYCISDMEDGIDQAIFTPSQFFSGIKDWVEKSRPSSPLKHLRETAETCSKGILGPDPVQHKDHFTRFKTAFTAAMIEEAARAYGDGGSEDIVHGTRPGLLDGTDADELLEKLKSVAGRFLYPSDRVQRPFLAGLRVTHGILDEYSKLLYLTREHFVLLRNSWRAADRGAVRSQGFETLLPLLDNLPPHYLDVYDSTAHDGPALEKWGEETWEWFCRAHLIIDYLSGMADDFAYRTYQVISGAQLE